MSKKKYDDICTLTNSIYKLCRTYVNGQETLELQKESGFQIVFLGRKIGLHLNEFETGWRATDMKTGLRINPYDMGTRGHLIHYLLEHIEMYEKLFADVEKMIDKENRFQVLLREMEAK